MLGWSQLSMLHRITGLAILVLFVAGMVVLTFATKPDWALVATLGASMIVIAVVLDPSTFENFNQFLLFQPKPLVCKILLIAGAGLFMFGNGARGIGQ